MKFLQAFDYWVSVHSLQTSGEGSILDPDDTLSDVVDDREQVSPYLQYYHQTSS